MKRLRTTLLAALLGFALPSSIPADFPTPTNSEKSATKALSAEQAAREMKLPPGFRASVFADEPDVQQPIAMCFDSRGRLWVAESYTYADQTLNYDLTLRDRVVVFEDSGQTGRFTKRTVFWDNAQRLTSIVVGMGGLYALSLPNLVFIADADGDLVPDASPEILLDGFDFNSARHTMANGLKWGPDGWLYGRQGILAGNRSRVGPPGTPDSRRPVIGCGVWRFHPTKHWIESLTEGTTNPWGMDWNEYGEPFFINTVIGHLWYMIPGAHYSRMFGDDPGQRVYGLIPQFADHLHWDTGRERWDEVRQKGVTAESSKAGGGHAHTGLMFYLGDNWPEVYRRKLFTINFHGRRLNMDRLERDGSGYVGRHGEDFALMADPWFRGIELIEGPDSGVYIADWADTGGCHDHDGVHRTSGRIYKITYDSGRKEGNLDVEKFSAKEIAEALEGSNEWKARQSLRVLQVRAAKKQDLSLVHQTIRPLLDPARPVTVRLRALWALSVSGGIDSAGLQPLLADQSEHVRTWTIRLLNDELFPPGSNASKDPRRDAFAAQAIRMAESDPSPLVRLAICSALRNFPNNGPYARDGVGAALLMRTEDAQDHNLPLMLWYMLSSLPQDKLVELAVKAKIPTFRRFAARRFAEEYDQAPAGLASLLTADGELAAVTDFLQGIAEGFIGRRRVQPPSSWKSLAERFGTEPSLQTRIRDLRALFGDGRALDEIRVVALNPALDNNSRRTALQVLIDSRAPDLRAVCEKLLDSRDLAATACAGLALSDDPAVADLLIRKLPSFYGHERPAGVSVLVSRPVFASKLLDAIAAKRISRSELTPFQARQIRQFKDPNLDAKLAEVWGEVRESPSEKAKLIAEWKAKLTKESLARANLSQGRTVYAQACASCHKLYGEGGAIGPDLTGSGRSNLDYLLENLGDPSAVVPADYRMIALNLKDGRSLSGVVAARSPGTITLQTPTERLTIERSEITETLPSALSLMPEGLIEALTETQMRDLIAYLMAPDQVPLPEKKQ